MRVAAGRLGTGRLAVGVSNVTARSISEGGQGDLPLPLCGQALLQVLIYGCRTQGPIFMRRSGACRFGLGPVMAEAAHAQARAVFAEAPAGGLGAGPLLSGMALQLAP